MPHNRVVLLNNHSLLAAGVGRLLEDMDGLELFPIAANDPDAIAEIGRRIPSVIILDAGDAALGAGFITQMLQEHPKARVIALNLDRKGIEVYRVRRLVETNLDGLMAAIQGRT